jgi:hypothetical protein
VLRILVFPAAAAVLIASAVAHGVLSNRWGPPKDLRVACDRLSTVPEVIGDWESRPMEVDPRQLEVAEAVGHLGRLYVNRRTGDEVSVLILCGRPGPIALHPPTVCYRGAGYSVVSPPEDFAVDSPAGRVGSLQTVRVTRDGPNPEPLRVFWGWSRGGPFGIPANPRMTYAGAPFLYKVYVVRRLPRAEEPLQGDPAADFVRELLPVLNAHLAP